MLAGTAIVLALNVQSADPKPLTNQREKASYGVGMNVGARFKHDFIELDVDAFVRGIRDAIAGTKPALTEKEIEEAIAAMTKEVEQKMSEEGEKSKKAGEAFLAENKKNKDVKVTESGLQYQVLKEGAGPQPKETDQVKVHYHGTLTDGTVFDSSVERGEPISFPLNRVIKGWVEALQLMKVGSKWKLFIPSNLAYGEQAQGKIPPHSVLVFEVELLGIEK
jgi:FKBP-type peptidyl-prolyl cis-trans isomerase